MIRYFSTCILILPAFLLNRPLFAQPETILPFSRALMPVEYYQEQAGLWAEEAAQQPGQASAWLNYFTAARNANVLLGQPKYDLSAIVAAAAGAIPHTFEYHYMAYWASPFEDRQFTHLLKARELEPQRAEAISALMAYYELQGRPAEFKAYCRLWHKERMGHSGILEWNYNALASLAEGAVLLTQGDSDTFPAWVLQEVENVRKDVRVLNLYQLLHYAEYRAAVFEELGLRDALALPYRASQEKQLEALIRYLGQYLERPLYLGIGTPKEVRWPFEASLYLSGLAWRYEKEGFDNLAALRNNLENRFRLDQLALPIGYDPAVSVATHMNLNYIPCLALLYKHYKATGEIDKAGRTKVLALNIAERAGKRDETGLYFDVASERPPFESLINLRSIEKNMQPLGGNLYAAATEVTNEQYDQFLRDLLQQREFGLLETSQIHPVGWLSLLPEKFRAQPEEVLFEKGHPEGPEMPVTNISLDAAIAYCDWLTMVYNQSDSRRRQFKKVRFRLPTEAEWKEAAKAGHDALFPWGGYYIQNSKGCYLANINPYLKEPKAEKIVFAERGQEECPGTDGVFFLAPAESYFPNDYGLYNLAGNVAEMVQEGSFTMGGSWLDAAYYAQIGKRHYRGLPSPAVGFRLFMEVLEE